MFLDGLKRMSILYSKNGCSLISHKSYIDSIYRENVNSQKNSEANLKKTFVLREELFEFNSTIQNDNDNSCKRQRKITAKKYNISISKNAELHNLNQKIASKSKDFLDLCRSKQFFKEPSAAPVATDNSANNSTSLSKVVSNESVPDGPLNGRNSLGYTVATHITGQTYLIPPNCKFTNSCVSEIAKFADGFYDFVVIDPPWWNKYIRRVRDCKPAEGYGMMYNEDILKIPLEDLVHPNSIVAIWCTNSPTHLEFIQKVALPKWNLKLVATFYWVKVTKSGEPICDFHLPLRKQPYEQLFLATHIESERVFANPTDDIQLIFSVPSVVNSHKPPLVGKYSLSTD